MTLKSIKGSKFAASVIPLQLIFIIAKLLLLLESTSHHKRRILDMKLPANIVFPSVSRSKDNKTIKFGQLIEYNMRKNFIEKSCTKCGGESIPRPFSKISKLSLSLDQ